MNRAMILLAASLMLGACAGSHSDDNAEEHEEEKEGLTDRVVLSEENARALGLQTETVELRELHPTLEVTAELASDPDRHAEIGPTVEGRVRSVAVRPGDLVRRGQTMAVLDSPDVGYARASYLTARAGLVAAHARWERERDLIGDNATSLQEFQEAEAAKVKAEAELAASRARLAALGAPVANGEDVAPTSHLVLRSPVAGVVTRRSAHLGQSVSPGDTLLEVVDLNEVWLRGSVYERDLRFVEPGLSVQIDIRAYPGEQFEGVVDQVGSTLDDATRTVGLRVILNNPDHRLRPGMFATARLRGTNAHLAVPTLTIPWSAVQLIDGNHYVFEATEEAYKLRQIYIGERAGGDVQVLSGLSAGLEIVTNGAFLLKGELLKTTFGDDD